MWYWRRRRRKEKNTFEGIYSNIEFDGLSSIS